MAYLALRAESAVMHIFAIMAGYAGPTQPGQGVTVGWRLVRQFMAVDACRLLVGAVDTEFGRGIVIEIPGLPCPAAVAAFTLVAVYPFVYIVLFVTTKALARCFTEGGRLMTLLAFGAGVDAGQREA